MISHSAEETLDKEVEKEDTEYGFTWVKMDDRFYIRNEEVDFKMVSGNIVEKLKNEATKSSVKELISEVDNKKPEAGRVLQGMYDDGFIREGEPVKRIDPPDDIRLWPQLLFSGLLYLILGAAYWITLNRFRGSGLNDPFNYLPDVIFITIPIVLAGIAIHELGHYIVSRQQGLGPSFGLSVINGFVPVIVTRTLGGWALPRNRRVWISLSGPVAGLLWASFAFLVYYFVWPTPGLALAGLICYIVQVNSILPIFHGDGYLILLDLLDSPNLKTRGLEDLRNKKLSWHSTYVFLSYGTIFALVAVEITIGYLVGDYLGMLTIIALVSIGVAQQFRSN